MGDAPRLRTLRRDLLRWGEQARRDLPWRRTRDPWSVLVSETMLQQTQVARVVPRYEAFLRRFPTPTRCARAPVSDVIEEWAGLGYNRRAVNLHRCATAVVRDHGGALPPDLAALLALPGVGPYTARAVLVFAYERDIGLVDTNAGRFVARALAGRGLPPGPAQSLADAAVPGGRGWAWGQAVFDLGASICTKRAPSCDRCPIRTSCAWSRAGFPEPDPIVGSAGVSRGQSAFTGSFRQGRGRLVARLRLSPRVDAEELADAAGWPADRARAAEAAHSLVADGLAAWSVDGALVRPR